MAGDWVVWTKGLSRKREVLAIAGRTGRDRRQVACLLMEFWEWADGETEDGYLAGVSVRNLSASQADTDDEFWGQVADVGWLEVTECGVRIPRFVRWMGKSAKRRLNDTNNKRQSRVGSVRNLSASDADKLRTKCGPEKEKEKEYRGMNSPMTPSCPETAADAVPRAADPPPEPAPEVAKAEPEGPPPILTFPCDGKAREWHLSEAQVAAWRLAYPSLDVLGECRKALAWVEACPERRKTARGMTRFLVGWLNRAQDSPRRTGPPPNGHAAGTNGKESRQETLARLLGDL